MNFSVILFFMGFGRSFWNPGIIVFLILIFCSSQGVSQVNLKYKTEEKEDFKTEQFVDSLRRAQFLEDILHSLRLQGYPTAVVKDKTFYRDNLTVVLEKGDLFGWLFLRQGNLGEQLANKVGFEARAFRNSPFSFESLEVLFKKILIETQNSGYPFAAVRLDSINQQERAISAVIDLQLGPFITFDTVQVTGNSGTLPLYLNRVLKIAPGTAFSQKKVDQSVKNLKNLPSLQLVSDPELSFQNQSAILYLPVNDRRINTVDGIIGILPNETSKNRILVTGEFSLALFNVWGRGRNYALNWQRINEYSQSLAISAEEPMLLGSSLDLEASYHLLKEDTTFINRDFRIGLGYRINPDIYIAFFSRRQSGDLLAVSQFAGAETLPDVADFRYNNYGIDLILDKRDDAFWPRRGVRTQAETGIGNKKLIQNTGLPSALYRELEMNSLQYYLTLDVEKHVYLRPEFGLMAGMRLGEMAGRRLLLNDLYRLGGLNSLRGFNQNFFFANRYFYASFEPRYYFDNRSYFLLFTDFGSLQNKVGQGGWEYPFSFGGGLSLESSGGVFHFIYAMGKSNTQALGFNFSKIHFGYTGRF